MYYIHPAARIFPLMTAEEFAGLKSDIQSHGLHEPILRDATGAVIDGRNRLKACEELGIEPTFRTFEARFAAIVAAMREFKARQIAA